MDFFDLNTGTSDQFRIGGPGHFALVLLLASSLVVLIALRRDLRALRQSRAFMCGTAAVILAAEAAAWLLRLQAPLTTVYDLLPLHLCASLKIAIPVLIMLERYDLVRPISTWAIGAGFISFANLNLEGHTWGQFLFWQYILGHLYLFLVPLFLFLAGDLRYDLRTHVHSQIGLFVWSLLVFGVNALAGTNYMYTGRQNHTPVPFIPDAMMAWPFNYVSYSIIGLLLINVIYRLLAFFQSRVDRTLNSSAPSRDGTESTLPVRAAGELVPVPTASDRATEELLHSAGELVRVPGV